VFESFSHPVGQHPGLILELFGNSSLRWLTNIFIRASVPSAIDTVLASCLPYIYNHDSEKLNTRQGNYIWQKTGKPDHNGLAKAVVFW
jgi:hypothetical protein